MFTLEFQSQKHFKTTSIIPVNLNLFFRDNEYSDSIEGFIRNNSIDVKGIKDIIDLINHNSNKYDYFAIDMKNISFLSSRIFSHFKGLKCLNKVFLFNVDFTSEVSKRIIEDIQSITKHFVKYNSTIYFAEEMKRILTTDYIKELNNCYKKKIVEIVESTAEDRIQFLDSSGVWSNKYINIRKIFEVPIDLYYIIYKLAERIDLDYPDVDTLISTSSTGSILATILGSVINKKVINCIGIGPKFSMKYEEINGAIKSDKKYLFIFDYICMGTELRILNSLIKFCDSDLIGGVGIASFINCYKKEYNNSIIGKAKTLVNIRDTNLDFKISIEEKELQGEV